MAALGLTTFLPVLAQDDIQKDSVPNGKEVKNRNVMLNASADNQPRQINIGLRQKYLLRSTRTAAPYHGHGGLCFLFSIGQAAHSTAV